MSSNHLKDNEEEVEETETEERVVTCKHRYADGRSAWKYLGRDSRTDEEWFQCMICGETNQ